jgi:membrane fusion protein (multidrug efflux system)
MKHIKLLTSVFGLALATASLPLLTGCGGSPSAQAADPLPRFPTPLSTATVQMVDTQRTQEIAGTVRPMRQATLSARLMGTILEFPFDLGEEVEAGQLILTLSAGEIRSRVEQARVANLQAQRDLDRETDLLNRGAATAETVRNLEDRQRMTRAVLEEAETLLSYTEIRAPFAGRITRKFQQAGDLATPGQPILEIQGLDQLQVEAAIPDQLARQLSLGQTVQVRLGSGVAGLATLAEISSAADPQTRTVQTKFLLPADLDARSGMFARVFIPAESVNRLIVPEAAVAQFGQIEQVFVVADGRVNLRIVRTGRRHDNNLIEILSGLEAGETVVVSPPPGLRSSQPVEIAGVR